MYYDDWFDSVLNMLIGGKVNFGMMGFGLLMEGVGVLFDVIGVGVFVGGVLNFVGGLMMDMVIGLSMMKFVFDIGLCWEYN